MCIGSLTGYTHAKNEKTMVLNYDGFFDRMDDLEAPEYSSIKLAFYLRAATGKPCDVNAVFLKTKHKSIEVYTLPDGELLLPFDPKLDQDKAAIVIEKNTDETCGLDMRLESTQLFTSTVTVKNSLELIETFDTAFSDLGGMMSFMLPKVQGITFLLEDGNSLYLLDKSLGKCTENSCTVTTDELQRYGKSLKFNQAPKKSVAYIQ